MKRFLCMLLCLLLAAPAAMAYDYTPTQLFRQQFVTGGNGLRGTVEITASGVADWVELLLPFAGTKLQVRIIGEKQGALADMVDDNNDWQMKMWVKDAQGEQQALTCFFGSPDGILVQSALLPDTLLNLPVKDVNLPYQVLDGQWLHLFSAFDPMGVTEPTGGNATAWSALTSLFSMGDEAWEAEWAPVMAKYETLLDMWLSGYATPTVVTGKDGMTLRTSYEIPVDEMKAEAKYLIGVMLSDSELLMLLFPHLTAEQRSLYANPAMLWFYEYCIDHAPISGSILLEREVSARGETLATSISLPLASIPAPLTDALGTLVADVFGLPATDTFAGIDRLSFRQAGEDLSISLSSPARTVSFVIDEREEAEGKLHTAGYLRITPAVGVEGAPLSAAFTYSAETVLYQDEEYNTHEDLTFALTLSPDLSQVSESDTFHSTYVDFAPMSFTARIGFTKMEKKSSPVQLSIVLQAVLADGEFGLNASLKVAERWEHDPVPAGATENLLTMTQERREELKTLWMNHAQQIMTTLAAPAQ